MASTSWIRWPLRRLAGPPPLPHPQRKGVSIPQSTVPTVNPSVKPRIVHLRDSLRSSSFKVEVKGYFDNSSIHGVRYITEKHRPNFERAIWGVVVGVALVYAGIYTLDVLDKTPILTDESVVYENHRVPLPGVTVCSNAKVSHTSNWGQGRTRSKDLHTLRFLCGEAFPNSRSISVKRLNETAPIFDNTCTLDIQQNGSLSQAHCSPMFQKVISEQGICYTFNSYKPENVYRDDVWLGDRLAGEFGGGLPADMGESCGDFPREQMLLSEEPRPEVEKHLKCGNHTLKVSMYSNRHDTGYCTFSNLTGFKVMIHNPKDAPSVGMRRLIWTKEEPSEFPSIDIKTETKVTVKAEARITSYTPNLLWFQPKKRQCYLENERYLRYFKYYTKFNCMLECLSNLTAWYCNCADFYMPRLNGTEVCKRVHLPCIFDVIDLARKKDYCECYPACYELTYLVQTRTFKDSGITEGQWNDTSLTVRLDRNVTQVIRRPSFTDLTVISNGGGVFGFFLGLSFLCLFEIFYFFTIRIFGNWYKTLKKK